MSRVDSKGLIASKRGSRLFVGMCKPGKSRGGIARWTPSRWQLLFWYDDIHTMIALISTLCPVSETNLSCVVVPVELERESETRRRERERERERERVCCTHNRENTQVFNVHFYCRQLRRYIFRRYICIYNWHYITQTDTHIHTRRKRARERERERRYTQKCVFVYVCVYERERERVFLPRFFFSSRDETPPNHDRVSPVPFPCFSNKCATLVSSRPNHLLYSST